MNKDVICVGQTVADVLIRGVDLATPFDGEMKRCDATAIGVGGDATNQSMVMSRLGLKTKLISSVGNDDLGEFLRMIVRKAGTDVSDMIVSDSHPSFMTVVVISPDGQRNFINTGVRNIIDFHVDPGVIIGAKVVSIASLLIPPFTTLESVEGLIDTAKENGSIICSDVVYKDGASLETFASVWPKIDYVFPNDYEAQLLTGKEDIDGMADVFLDCGVKNVIIKIGKRGCFFKNKDTRVVVPTFDSPVIDTTGAGDNFASGFIAAMLDGKSPEECCFYGNAVASVACRFIGANTGVRNREQIEEFLKQYKQYPAE